MGIGDEIMASGHARSTFLKTGRRVQILDRTGRPRWHSLWQGLPWIARPAERGLFSQIYNAGGCRPYVSYPFTKEIGQTFTDWRAQDNIGEIRLTEKEKRFGAAVAIALKRSFVIFEPNLKSTSNPNKDWGWENWKQLSFRLKHLNLVQLGPKGTRVLPGVRFVQTRDIREAAAVLKFAEGAVLAEGGLHHAAAVMGTRATVLFGGAPSIWNTGYDFHVNIGTDVPCGRWVPCLHCARFWKSLSPERVASAVEQMLESSKKRGVSA